ncbi:Uncharacterized protein conserved in bacteria (plasmid) [Tsukamurella tyrosinosolvens]|uniref:DUF4440 domain-containing protein n=1 Tax=Tsukamurella tyrosinosolvens TaxID=57704 RepID=A0A1H4ZGI4_TSUTY|nr:DUF4440 domain-containing protein [Tsukamurella tyrosinosolvens]KXO95650.1 DUF4440 domain-containing protein [Tsukamurella tyrosinosolvens]MEC4612037.1 DUF4440 domain-containing protein [Tsukamurella tyrosinosolvens]SED28758.1 hypothetical protein SAMN04489793_4540 [Tsukamurella tyrosinosolvens]VEI01131.1 Uncharacterized protein conserved in bacteria [Tsukamurella tyrosinosolvens]
MIEEEPDRTTEPELREVLAELRRREPVFHGPSWRSLADFDDAVAPDFWEVGASGRRYSREHVRAVTDQRIAAPPDESDWETSEFQVRAMGASVYLLTYTLAQGDRVTRRLTVWRRRENRWTVMFHQGTVVAD